MTAPRIDQVLFDFGGSALLRTGRALRRRSFPLDPATIFARADSSTVATYRDATGQLRRAAAGKLRVHYVDLDGDGVFETPTILNEPASTNRAMNTEDLDGGGWFLVGTPVVTDSYATLGGLTLTKIEDNDGVNEEYLGRNYAAEANKPWAAGDGDGVKGVAFFWMKADVESAGGLFWNLTDTDDAAATRCGATVRANGDGSPNVTNITGTFLGAEKWGIASNGRTVYRLHFATTSAVVVSHVHVFRFFPTGSAAGAQVGDAIVGGVHIEAVLPWPSSYINNPTSTQNARVADDWQALLGLSPSDDEVTVYSRVVRPPHADLGGSVALTGSPGPLQVSNVNPRWGTHFNSAARTIDAFVDDGVTLRNKAVAIPAGAAFSELDWIARVRNLKSGGSVTLDVGTGLQAYSSATGPITAYGAPRLVLAKTTYGLGSGLIRCTGVRGAHTLDEMRAVFRV